MTVKMYKEGDCLTCDGKGVDWGETCISCGGSGKAPDYDCRPSQPKSVAKRIAAQKGDSAITAQGAND